MNRFFLFFVLFCFFNLASLVAQLVESTCNAGDLGSIPGLGRSAGEGIGLPTPVFLGFPGDSDTKESTCNAGDLSSIPGSGRSPGEGNGYPLQYAVIFVYVSFYFAFKFICISLAMPGLHSSMWYL